MGNTGSNDIVARLSVSEVKDFLAKAKPDMDKYNFYMNFGYVAYILLLMTCVVGASAAEHRKHTSIAYILFVVLLATILLTARHLGENIKCLSADYDMLLAHLQRKASLLDGADDKTLIPVTNIADSLDYRPALGFHSLKNAFETGQINCEKILFYKIAKFFSELFAMILRAVRVFTRAVDRARIAFVDGAIAEGEERLRRHHSRNA